jgi:hypothetical protein
LAARAGEAKGAFLQVFRNPFPLFVPALVILDARFCHQYRIGREGAKCALSVINQMKGNMITIGKGGSGGSKGGGKGGGVKGGNGPSTTGNPSGGGRGNNPPGTK